MGEAEKNKALLVVYVTVNLRNCLNIANELFVQFDYFGYLSLVKRTSNEAVGPLDQVITLTFPLRCAWYSTDGW